MWLLLGTLNKYEKRAILSEFSSFSKLIYYCLQEYEPIYLANYQARTSGERLHQGRRIYGYLENFILKEIHHLIEKKKDFFLVQLNLGCQCGHLSLTDFCSLAAQVSRNPVH